MFVGHYAAALAAKASEPRAPLWTYVGACQLLDIGWSSLVALGVEKVRIEPSLPGSGLDLYYMPFTHSLPGAAAISVGAAVLARVFRLPWMAAIMIGLTGFSHWVLDLIVHRPDLVVWWNQPKVGFAFWNYPLPELGLELGLVACAGAAWTAQRKTEGRRAWPAVVFIALLCGLQMVNELGGGMKDPVALGVQALVIYLAFTAIAWVIDRRPAVASQGADAVA
jgi:hypothetical protein